MNNIKIDQSTETRKYLFWLVKEISIPSKKNEY